MLFFFLPSKFRMMFHTVLGVLLLVTGTATLVAMRMLGGAEANTSLAWLQYVGAVIFLIPMGIHLTTEISGEMFSAIFFSHHAPSKMPLRTSLPEGLAKKGQYDEALAVYAQLAKMHPEDAIPHIGRIRVAVEHFHDVDLADQFYEEGMTKLALPEARRVLSEMYEGILAQAMQRNPHLSAELGLPPPPVLPDTAVPPVPPPVADAPPPPRHSIKMPSHQPENEA